MKEIVKYLVENRPEMSLEYFDEPNGTLEFKFNGMWYGLNMIFCQFWTEADEDEAGNKSRGFYSWVSESVVSIHDFENESDIELTTEEKQEISKKITFYHGQD